MSHFVFVESNTTGTGARAVEKMLARGDRVTFLTRDYKKYPFLACTHPRLWIRELDTNSFVAVMQAIREVEVKEAVDAVLTFSEFYVPLVGEVAFALGLHGLNPEAARICRHKPSTRKKLREAGLLTPEFYLVASEEQAEELAGRITFPCIVKPPSDSSSHGVRLVRDFDDFMEHYRALHGWKENMRGQVLDGSVLVESVIQGPEYSVETVTLPSGDTVAIGVTDKHLSDWPNFVEMGHDFPSQAPDAIKQALVDTVLQALAAVKFDFGPAHTEIRMTQQGPVVVEINPRLAGGMIPEIVGLATGIDLLEVWMDLLLSRPVDLTPQRQDVASIRFLTAQTTGELVDIHGIKDAARIPSVREISASAKPGASVRPPTDAYDRLGFVIASGSDPARVFQDLQLAMETIQIDVEPADRCVPA
jgi:cysteine synthase A